MNDYSRYHPMSDAEFDIERIDPGIRRLVAWLRSLGYKTTDSGDGVSKTLDVFAQDAEQDALDFAHVHISIGLDNNLSWQADKLHRLMKAAGITEGQVQVTYSPNDGIATLSVFGITDADLPAGL